MNNIIKAFIRQAIEILAVILFIALLPLSFIQFVAMAIHCVLTKRNMFYEVLPINAWVCFRLINIANKI